MTAKKIMTASQIIEMYKKGERNFSNVRCTNDSFGGADLKNAVFRNSDLSFSSFREASLQGADFSGSNLEWSSLEKANLTGAKFIRAKVIWSVLNDAIVDKTDFTGTDFSWSILINVNLHAASLAGTEFSTAILKPEDLTKDGIEKANMKLGMLKNRLPLELWFQLRFSVSRVEETFSKSSMRTISFENIESSVSYSIGASSGYKGIFLVEGHQSTVYSQGPVYASVSTYRR